MQRLTVSIESDIIKMKEQDEKFMHDIHRLSKTSRRSAFQLENYNLRINWLKYKISFTNKATSDRTPSVRLYVAEKLTETEDIKIECGLFENSLSLASFCNSLIALKGDFKKLIY